MENVWCTSSMHLVCYMLLVLWTESHEAVYSHCAPCAEKLIWRAGTCMLCKEQHILILHQFPKNPLSMLIDLLRLQPFDFCRISPRGCYTLAFPLHLAEVHGDSTSGNCFLNPSSSAIALSGHFKCSGVVTSFYLGWDGLAQETWCCKAQQSGVYCVPEMRKAPQKWKKSACLNYLYVVH